VLRSAVWYRGVCSNTMLELYYDAHVIGISGIPLHVVLKVELTVETTERLNCSCWSDICMSSVFPIVGLSAWSLDMVSYMYFSVVCMAL
jgi:hypothetical protein